MNDLQEFLKVIADSIRTKKGTTELINPQDFAEEIESLSSSSTPVVKSDVNFYDYDGTLLHSYSKSEFLALQELPNLPTQPGLICQEWNYSLTDAQEYVTNYGVLDIGATYITDDEKTRLYIRIAAPGRMDVPLYFSQTVSDGVTIDWGDGSATETLSGTGNVNTTHTYAEIGDYCISLAVNSGELDLGHRSASYGVMGENSEKARVYFNMLQKVYIGKGVISIGDYAFRYCYSLTSIIIPSGVTSIGNYAFQYCQSLASIIIPSGVTSIDSSVFSYCQSLPSIVIPSGVTSIGNYAFQYCYGMKFYDFSSVGEIPILSSTNNFSGITSDCKIVVPDNLYDFWKAATNWSTYASYIVKSSEFNG